MSNSNSAPKHNKPSSKVFVVAAASGTGKTSLLHAAAQQIPELRLSISHTTRPPRVGEVDGRDYFFIGESQFNDMVRAERFLEYAQVFNHYYGTSRDEYEAAQQSGGIFVMEIDCQGARQVRERLGDEVTGIFILPPSKEALRERLAARGQDAPEVIERRIQEADGEIAQAHLFDIRIVNDDFDTALRQLVAALRTPPPL